MSAPILVLASASPRRAAILTALGIPFRAITPSADETLLAGEAGAAAAERLARAKAEAVLPQDLPVLAADTLVLCDGAVLGKPATPADAARMLRTLSGRTHEVVTGMCLAHGSTARSGVETTAVTFAPMSDAEIDWYVASGEPMDKAGAYAIQGLASRFAARINGSYPNVVGLPVAVVYQLCTNAGLLIS